MAAPRAARPAQLASARSREARKTRQSGVGGARPGELGRFLALAAEVVGLYLLQAVFAEDISAYMNGVNTNVSWFMSLLNVVSQLLLASFSLSQTAETHSRRGPRTMSLASMARRYRWEYLACSITAVLFNVLNNYATFFVAFNTVQLFKASKVAFVMAGSALLLRRKYSLRAVVYCLLLVLGLYILSQADLGGRGGSEDIGAGRQESARLQVPQVPLDAQPRESVPSKGRPTSVGGAVWGFIVMFIASVCIGAHAIVQEAVLQGRALAIHGTACARGVRMLAKLVRWPLRPQEPALPLHARESMTDQDAQLVRDELIVFTNTMTLAVLCAGALATGELREGIVFFASSPRRFLLEEAIILTISSVGQRRVLSMAQSFGSTSATIVVTVRKCITFGISVLVFPKPFTMGHGAALALITISACLLQVQLMREDGAAKDEARVRTAPALQTSRPVLAESHVNFRGSKAFAV